MTSLCLYGDITKNLNKGYSATCLEYSNPAVGYRKWFEKGLRNVVVSQGHSRAWQASLSHYYVAILYTAM